MGGRLPLGARHHQADTEETLRKSRQVRGAMTEPNRRRNSEGPRLVFLSEDEAVLKAFRQALLQHHRNLLEVARRDWQRLNERVVNPSEMLQLLMDEPSLQWLRVLSSMIARLDEDLVDPLPGAAESILEAADRLLLGADPENVAFQILYRDAVSRSAEVALTHVQVVHAIRPLRGRKLPLQEA